MSGDLPPGWLPHDGGPCPVERARERLHYDPDTGELRWRAHPSMPSWWNTQNGGRPAFTARSGSGYRYGSIDGVRLPAHRLAWAIYYGAWPIGEIDHVDHDKRNNRIANLRLVNRTQNNRNQPRRRDNRSGHTGVVRFRRKWQAQIGVDGKVICLGKFDRIEDAVAARKAAEMKFGFHRNHGTLPEEPTHDDA